MGKDKKESTLGVRLKQAREAAGISQQELASRAGLSMSLVAGIEQGRATDPRLSTLLALAGVLGVKLEDIVPSDPQGSGKSSRK